MALTSQTLRVGLVGARGYTGGELIGLLANHGQFDLALASSRELSGKSVHEHIPRYEGELRFEDLTSADIASRRLDAYVLALPNGHGAEVINAIQEVTPTSTVIDLSTDHRFDDTWTYGLPELCREHVCRAKRIANPGCYATGIQIAVAPLLSRLSGPVHAFGISGYSGAGTAPSPKNDPELLRDNLMPYSLIGHVHERETTERLGHPVHFMPHVAPFFRGITLTISMSFGAPITPREVRRIYESRYESEPLISVVGGVPLVKDAAGKHEVRIGGLSVSEDGMRAVIVVTLDNLLKGAATQALQNLNLAFGLRELEGIAP